MEVIATAPGKIFVVGEYAVALGAPAIVATIERRVGCRARRGPGSGRLFVRTPAGSWCGSLHRAELIDAPAAYRFAVAAARASAHRFSFRDQDVSLETWTEIDSSGPKTGLGGSAAVVCAVTAAMHCLAEGRFGDPRSLAGLAVAAHRLAQGGGSGADVVAAMLGGLQYVRGLDASDVPRDVAACTRGVSLQAERLELPGALVLEAVATDRPVGTGPRVRRFLDRARGCGALGAYGAALVRTWTAEMAAASDAFRDACREPSPAYARAALARAGRLLEQLGPLAGLGVWTRELRRAAEAVAGDPEVAVKPSGAGGGDCAVALLPGSRVPEARAAWRSFGLRPLEADASLDGVRVEVVREGEEHG